MISFTSITQDIMGRMSAEQLCYRLQASLHIKNWALANCSTANQFIMNAPSKYIVWTGLTFGVLTPSQLLDFARFCIDNMNKTFVDHLGGKDFSDYTAIFGELMAYAQEACSKAQAQECSFEARKDFAEAASIVRDIVRKVYEFVDLVSAERDQAAYLRIIILGR